MVITCYAWARDLGGLANVYCKMYKYVKVLYLIVQLVKCAIFVYYVETFKSNLKFVYTNVRSSFRIKKINHFWGTGKVITTIFYQIISSWKFGALSSKDVYNEYLGWSRVTNDLILYRSPPFEIVNLLQS